MKKTCTCSCTNFKNFLVKISDPLGWHWSFLNLLNMKSFETHAFRHLNHMRKPVSKIHTELLCPPSLCTWMIRHLHLISLYLLSYIFLKAFFILLALSIYLTNTLCLVHGRNNWKYIIWLKPYCGCFKSYWN